MNKWDFFGLYGVIKAIEHLTKEIKIMAADVTALKAKVVELEAKVDETVVTLTGLAQAIVDLKAEVAAGAAVQPAIDEVAAQAQTILDKLGAAEDAADDQLPPVEPPVV